MNYTEFLTYKIKMIKENSALINLAENNLYDKLQYLVPQNLELEERAYRCHIADYFLASFNLDPELKSYLAITQGVRHSLSSLFPKFSNWIIPLDQYPFYSQELTKQNLSFKTYKTINENNVFKNLTEGTLLITYPLKLGNREYSPEEFKSLNNFLSLNSQNTLVIDLVYWLGDTIPSEILQLYKSNQVILLYSLAKKYLLPNHGGFTLLPQTVIGKSLTLELAKLEKNEERLKIVQTLLKHPQMYSSQIKTQLIKNYHALEKIGLNFNFNYMNPEYLFYHPASPESFLKQNILVIPESVFGGTGKGSIVSSLL